MSYDLAAYLAKVAAAKDTPSLRRKLASKGARATSAETGIPRRVLAALSRRMRADMRFPPGIWKYVPSTAEDYIVSTDGSIMSRKGIPRWRRLSPVYRGKYRAVVLSLETSGGYARRRICEHQLVLSLFGPPRPTVHHIVCHKDDDAANNSIENLYWGTCRDNQLDSVKNKRVGCRLSVDMAVAVFRANGTKAAIAKQFGANYSQVCSIRAKRTYADFTRGVQRGLDENANCGPFSAKADLRFTEHEIRSMRAARADGATYSALAKKYKACAAVIRRIAIGSSYSWVPGPLAQVAKFHTVIRNLPTPVSTSPIEYGRLYDPDHRPPKEAS